MKYVLLKDYSIIALDFLQFLSSSIQNSDGALSLPPGTATPQWTGRLWDPAWWLRLPGHPGPDPADSSRQPFIKFTSWVFFSLTGESTANPWRCSVLFTAGLATAACARGRVTGGFFRRWVLSNLPARSGPAQPSWGAVKVSVNLPGYHSPIDRQALGSGLNGFVNNVCYTPGIH